MNSSTLTAEPEPFDYFSNKFGSVKNTAIPESSLLVINLELQTKLVVERWTLQSGPWKEGIPTSSVSSQ